ncbi:MAG: hypothetical protein ACK57N_11805 [Planctomycetia bacterium]
MSMSTGRRGLVVVAVSGLALSLYLLSRTPTSHEQRTDPVSVDAAEAQPKTTLAQPRQPAPVATPPTTPSAWEAIKGERWDEIRRKNLEAGLDLGKRAPPVPWEEARVQLGGELAKLGDEQAKVNIGVLTAFNGQFDRQWTEANQLEGFEITEESKADLLAIEEKHQATMRPLAEQWVYEVNSRLLQAWKSQDIERAPYNLNHGDIDGRMPKSGTFYQKSFCAGGWCARIGLRSADGPEVEELERQLSAMRGRKAAELSSYARKNLKRK